MTRSLQFNLPWPWRALDRGQELDELQRRYEIEITVAHPLAGRDGRIVARSDVDDDVLIKMQDARFAIVHLLWREGGPDLPHFVILKSIDDVLRSV